MKNKSCISDPLFHETDPWIHNTAVLSTKKLKGDYDIIWVSIYSPFSIIIPESKKLSIQNIFIYLRGKPVREVAAFTRNFSHGVHTFSLNFRQY